MRVFGCDEFGAEQVQSTDALPAGGKDVLLHQVARPRWPRCGVADSPAHVQARSDLADRCVSQLKFLRPAEQGPEPPGDFFAAGQFGWAVRKQGSQTHAGLEAV